MSSEHYQPNPETLRSLRFTARDPILDEALGDLEAESYRHSDQFPRHLFIYSKKYLHLDTSDMYDGRSQNIATYEQYRHTLTQNVSERGRRRFKLTPFMSPVVNKGDVVGVNLRVAPDSLTAKQLIAPPFYTGGELNAGYIPAFYRMERPAEDLEVPLDRLERVLALGTWVAELTIIPLVPRAARMRDVFMGESIQRTGKYVEAALANEPPLPPVIELSSERQRLHPEGNGTGPEAA